MAISDSLQRYRDKRDFSITSEPAEGGAANASARAFVVQKHWASRLHYDFRLELDGAMKSWAVPKGPSFDTHDRRMAVHVEDHPISYNAFEGTIPPKQYGAGKVIIWDKGTWLPEGDPHQGYRDGNLKFELRGHKLHGRWVLVRMKGHGEKQEAWLLIKEKDDYARPAADYSVVDEMPDSVKDLPPVAAVIPPSAPAAPAPKAAKAGKLGKAAKAAKAAASLPVPAVGKKATLPAALQPQLATLVNALPADPEAWLYEIKFDGYRMLTRIDAKTLRLHTRNGNDWTSKLPGLAQQMNDLALPPGWYDGEIVVLGASGVPDFQALQGAFETARSDDIVYYLFDIPYFAGYDLRSVPLLQRREALQAALGAARSTHVRFSEAFDAPAHDIVASACRLGLEGIIAKRKDSSYASRRSPDWIKLKCSQRQEFVIGGYTDPKGSRIGIGSLLLGVHDAAGTLQYAGNVGTGFDESTLRTLRSRLDAIPASRSPYAKATGIDRQAHWVEPLLLAEVSFGEWTKTGRIRHSAFHGLRCDKKPIAIVREEPMHMSSGSNPPGATQASRGSTAVAASTLPPNFRVTNPQRVIDPQSGATKIDLVRYYALVAPLMMPHLKGRPVSLVRAPAGIGAELFFQKHAETSRLPGVRQLDPALFPGHPSLLEIVTPQGLLSVAQWNVVEIHTVNARAKSFDTPDRMVFDLDPGEGVAWGEMQEAAELVRVLLTEIGLTPFLKTSGGKGLHVIVPVSKGPDWDTVKGFSQAIVQHLAAAIPQRFVAKSGPKNRVGKVFADYLRNGLAATTVAAWSARARPGLGISVPVAWSELKSLDSGAHWNVRTVHSRLDQGNEPWKDYDRSARPLKAAMKQLGYSQ